jgi:hypothetical protein
MGYISTDTLKEILRELDNKLTGMDRGQLSKDVLIIYEKEKIRNVEKG